MHRKVILAAGVCLLAACLLFLMRSAPTTHAAAFRTPAYAANGDLLPLANYREWIYLSSGIDMSYSPKAADTTSFDNVFVNPEAYRSFLATGTWPDKTVLVVEVREAESKGSINQHGHFQGAGLIGFEAHVKDEARFPGGWAFFDFHSPTTNGKLIPRDASCYSCHAEHGAVDTTFVQFYPTLLPVAREKKTLSEAFLKEDFLQPAGTASQ
ncbi:MAG TPA: cytochrome P460 family protein [Acidobacteriaceae bacterium]|jgi:hypothetical protein|nr:cytochrome P460 family protein [Acidobacteriaceae bacterium]